MSISSILVPTDFSKCALNATKYAIRIALELESRIIFVTGYHLPYSTAEFGAAVDQSMIKLFEDESEENFIHLCDTLPELKQIHCDYKPILAQAREAIQKAEEVETPDLIIMGTHGNSGVGQSLFGSITSSVIGAVSTPLLAIPNKATYRSFRRIALGCDFRLIKDYTVLDSLLTLVRVFDSELHLVHVSEHVGDIDVDEQFEAQKLKDYFVEVGHFIHELADKNIEEALISFAQKNDVDALALLPRKRSLLHRLVSHSVTRRVAMESSLPILILPG